MIQLSIGIYGDDLDPANTGGAPPAPLALTTMGWGVRVTGVWPTATGGVAASPALATLATARRELGEWLAAQPPDATAKDLLTGRASSVGELAQRLMAPPSVPNVFVARHTIMSGGPPAEEGRIWARLFGGYALGEPDLIVTADPDVDVARVYDVLNRWAAFRLDDGRELDLSRPIPYGYWFLGTAGTEVADQAFWTLLRERLEAQHLKEAFDSRMATPSPRVVIEADRVDQAEPGNWLIGASRALRTAMAQRATLERAGLDPAGQSRWAPSAHDAAAFCERLDDPDTDELFAYREHPQSDLDSGWRFACLDETHRHDEATLRLAPLWRLTPRFPELVKYFALPPGWVVARESGSYWMRPPGEERAYKDDVGGLLP
ncbi:MAG: hypothetical protein U1F43_20000 [Myxococcota bacterium]